MIKKCLQYSKTIRNPDVSIFECDINGRIIQLPNNSGYIKMDNNYKGYTIKTYRRMLGKYFDIRFDINQFQTNYLKNLSEIMLTRLKNLPIIQLTTCLLRSLKFKSDLQSSIAVPDS